MSLDASITLDWADGTYVFRLAWSELEMLQEAVDAGPWVVLGRLFDRTCRVGDISHVIRLGLIGGGKEPVEALKLTRAYVEARPPAENVMVAIGILGAALNGAREEPVGETVAANPEAVSA